MHTFRFRFFFRELELVVLETVRLLCVQKRTQVVFAVTKVLYKKKNTQVNDSLSNLFDLHFSQFNHAIVHCADFFVSLLLSPS